jgi:hypothetical protein
MEESATEEILALVLDQLHDAESLLEHFENLEVLYACMIYASRHSQWPTMAEIVAISGRDIDCVLEVEERIDGIYEFALRNRLIEEHG